MAHWSQFAGGGLLEDQRLTGRGCKPQTNYKPSPHTAGRITGKNILFNPGARQENMIQTVEPDLLSSSSRWLEIQPEPFELRRVFFSLFLSFPVSVKFLKRAGDLLTPSRHLLQRAEKKEMGSEAFPFSNPHLTPPVFWHGLREVVTVATSGLKTAESSSFSPASA